MIPLHLSIAGFLSYCDPVEIDFALFDLACIAGPNGAGKSSLLDAITWALFGQARKRDDALINAQSSTADVCFTFGYEGNIYRVQRVKPRDKTALLEFHILQGGPQGGNGAPFLASPGDTWKPLTERTLRDTESRIQQTLRLDYETFVNASFFLQGKADQFTQQRSGDRKRILSSILGLEVWDSYRQRATERRREAESQINALEGRLHEINTELSEEAARRAHLEELQTALGHLSQARASQETALESIRAVAATLAEQRKLVETLGRGVDAAARSLEELQSRLASRGTERDSFAQILALGEEIEAAYTAWEGARARLERWEAIAARFREQEKRRQGPLDEINASRAALQHELQALQQKEAEAASGGAQLPGLQAQLASLQEQIERVEGQLARRAGLAAELAEAQGKLAEAKAENPRLRAEMDELKERIDQLSQAEGAICPLCGQPLSPDDRHALIESLAAQGKEMGDRYRANKALLEQAGDLVRDLEVQIAALLQAENELRGHNQALVQLTSRLDLLRFQQDEWEDRHAPRRAEILRSLEGEDFAPEARARLAEIDAELKAIGYDAAAHDADRREETAGRAAAEQKRVLERAQAALQPLDREIAELRSQETTLRTGVDRQRAEFDQAAVNLAASQAQAPDLEAAERELYDLQEQENRLLREVGAASQKVAVLDGLKTRRRALEVERGELALQVSHYKQLERAFGKDGVPALLIEQALPQIEAKANEILDRLSLGGMSVRFITQAAYKDKRRDDLKETLDILISDAAGTRDYEMFSGGEAFRVNFAIRLALSEVLSQRAGARLQTLVIDEGFGSQDTHGRQRLIEAINLVRPDFAKILVITHIDELKDAFPVRIEVEKTPRGSSVRVF